MSLETPACLTPARDQRDSAAEPRSPRGPGYARARLQGAHHRPSPRSLTPNPARAPQRGAARGPLRN